MPMLEIPNLRHLRMVQMIGRLRGVGSASRELNTSQPAVTQAVANLESFVGAEVFDRGSKGTYPTPAGAVFLMRIDRFFEILDTAVHDVLGSGEQPGRQLPLVERIITGTQIRALIATAEPATVQDTAQRLGVSAASLYRSARTLEKALGHPLFDRSAYGPICNRTGAVLARQFRRAVREIEFAHDEIKLLAGQEDVEIVIGMLPMSGTYELAHAVRDFSSKRPHARVKVVSGDYHGLLDDLSGCRIDMIFGLLRRPDWVTDIVEEVLFQDSYCVVARPGHPLAKLKSVTPQDLLEYDWVVPPEGTPRRLQIEQLFHGLGRKPRFNVETSSLTASRAFMLSSDLITVMTRSEVQIDASFGMMESLPCAQLTANPPKGVATRADWLPTSVHEEFIACLRKVTSAVHHEQVQQRRIALVS